MMAHLEHEGVSKATSLDILSATSKSEPSFSFSNASLQPESDKVGSLFHSFIDAHTKLLKEIDESDWDDIHKLQEKVKVLESYTRQLAEQNEVLVKSVEELEREAEHRAIQLESRLKKSAKATKEAVLRLHEYEQDVRNLVRENVRKGAALEDILSQVMSLKVENSFLRDQNANLRHDIKALLHIIHQARSTGHWELECVTFCEVTPEQVFGPVHPLSKEMSRDSLGWQELTVPYRNGSQSAAGKCNMSERSSCLTSHHSSFSNLPDADLSPSAQYSDQDMSCGRLERELRHLQHWREEAQLELLEKDKLITTLEAQITTLNHELMVKQAECDYHVLDIGLLRQQAKAEQRRESDGGAPLITAPEHHGLFRDARSYPCGIDCLGLLAENYMFPKCLQDVAVQVNLTSSQHRSCQTHFPSSSDAKHPLPLLKANSNISFEGHHEQGDRDAAILSSPPHRCRCSNVQGCSSSNETFGRWKHSDVCLILHNNDLDADRQLSNSSLHSSEQFYVFEECTFDTHSRKSAQQMEEDDSLEERKDAEILCSLAESPLNLALMLEVGCQTDSPCFVQTETHLVSTSEKQLQTDPGTDKTDSSVQTSSPPSNSQRCMDYEEAQSVQKLKEHIRKIEDKATSKEMLVGQLQKHLENAIKEVTLKDTALENAERKLCASREECSRLNAVISSLEADIERLKQDVADLEVARSNLKKNVDAREEQIQEIKGREEVHQEQKRMLMIQLDDQGEKLMESKSEVTHLRTQLEAKVKEVESQTETIRYLQEALVQTKMALEEARLEKINNNRFLANSHPKVNTLSRSQVMDV